MPATTRVALRPKSEAPRRPWPVERGTTNFINYDGNADNIPALRLQCLQRFGVIGQRAGLLAGMVWEKADG